MEVKIIVDDLSSPQVNMFLEEHIAEINSISPPESNHALSLDELKQLLDTTITFWTVWTQNHLIGCGALKELDNKHAEIKSMQVTSALRGKGVASKLLRFIIKEAQKRFYTRLSLETGSMAFFEPARKLYEKFGFEYCAPFSDYKEDPNNTFMSLSLLK